MTTKRIAYAYDELAERGWTKELISAYLPPMRSSHRRDLVHQIEETDQWQADAERAKTTKVFINKTDLKQRGWTQAMVRDTLGEPAFTVQISRSGDKTMSLYRLADVECTVEFTECQKKAKTRTISGAKVAERRAEEMKKIIYDEARQLLRLHPVESRDELERLATDHADMTSDIDDHTMYRICGNYLRHECSNYEDLLSYFKSKYKGQPGITGMYKDVVRPYIDELVNKDLASKGIYGYVERDYVDPW